jgi:GNAT superfamily N-acetyltransferase
MGLLMAVTMSPQGLVAEDTTGTIVGAFTLRTVRVGKRKLGILDWVVVDPQHQGQGISKILADQALSWFRQQGCEEVITTGVDGYNSAAWNAAYSCGLRYWSVSQQIREFGWRWLKLLIVIPHIGVTTFILHSALDEQEQPEPSATSGVGMLISVTLFLGLFLLPLSRVREVLWESIVVEDLLAPFNPTVILVGVGIMAIYMSIRTGAHWLAARTLRLPLTFRLWDSGLIVATLLAAAFSGFLPGFGGSFYIRQTRFDYSQARPAMGKIMLAGVAASLALFTVFTLWSGPGTGTLGEITMLGRYVGLAFGITDTLLFFAPFQALPAGHLWRWRRAVWLVVAVGFVGIWLVLPRIL